ncbi:MAG: hypothetical protein AAB339_05985, partial [Elusimicrobiota bacterium]
SARRTLDAVLGERSAADERLGPLREETRRFAWRIGGQEALEADIRRIETDLARLDSELAAERRRLSELEDELERERRRRPRDPADPQDPSRPQDPQDPSRPGEPQPPRSPHPWLPWALMGVGAALLAWALLEWLSHRKKQSPPR